MSSWFHISLTFCHSLIIVDGHPSQRDFFFFRLKIYFRFAYPSLPTWSKIHIRPKLKQAHVFITKSVMPAALYKEVKNAWFMERILLKER
jgi:hypothetical protein